VALENGRARINRISFQLTNRRDDLSAYPQFFGTDPRVPLFIPVDVRA
jgi:hypothetical protein